MLLRQLGERLDKHRERIDNIQATMIESSSTKSSTQSKSESTTKSNPDLSQELKTVENLFQAERKKMNERIVRLKKSWTSFRSKTSASSQNGKKLSKNDIILI